MQFYTVSQCSFPKSPKKYNNLLTHTTFVNHFKPGPYRPNKLFQKAVWIFYLRAYNNNKTQTIRITDMGEKGLSVCLAVILIASAAILTGCVERKLTINTEPAGATVILNDEEIGTSPVTVSFNWYGDYNIRITKEGYETLKTHRELKGPWYDVFPFDFFAMLNPARTVDSYEWTFELAPKQEPTREQLLQNAEELKEKVDQQ
jgi:hypothetical protein